MASYSSYTQRLLSPGLLPTPNSPIIQDSNVNKYIKPSYFPIPYQAVIAVECSNVADVSSWDVNVSSKSIKIKIEWSINTGSCNVLKDLFPKAVLNAISTYNLIQPSWSTSYSSTKLLLRVDWNLASYDGISQQNTSISFPSPFTPTNQSFSSPFKPNASQSFHDSGYKSMNSNQQYNVNNSRLTNMSPFPPTKLFQRNTKHDVFRPKSNYKDSLESPKVNLDVSRVEIPPEKPEISKINNAEVNLRSHTSDVDFQETHASVDDNNNCNSELPISDPVVSKSSLDAVIHENTESTKQDNVSKSSESREKPVHDTKSKSSESPKPSELLKSSELPKYTVSESKTGLIVVTRDQTIDPETSKFVKAPDPVPKSPRKKFLNQKLDAGRMSITGYCRLCGQQVKSCFADYHLLVCDEIDEMELIDFYNKYAANTRGTNCDIEAMAYEYCEYKLTDHDVNNIFDMSTIQNFIDELECMLEKRATDVFKKLGFPDQKRRYNILEY